MTYAWFDVTRNAGIARIMLVSYRSKTYTWNDVILVKRSMIRVFAQILGSRSPGLTTKLNIGAPNIFVGSQYGTCFIITLLAPRILRWLQVFFFFLENIYTPVLGFCCYLFGDSRPLC